MAINYNNHHKMNVFLLQINKQNFLKIETINKELYFGVSKIFVFTSYICFCTQERARVCVRVRACVRACLCAARVRLGNFNQGCQAQKKIKRANLAMSSFKKVKFSKIKKG